MRMPTVMWDTGGGPLSAQDEERSSIVITDTTTPHGSRMPPAYDSLAARDDIDEGLCFEQHGVLDSALVHYERAARTTRDAALISEAFRRQSSVHRTRCEWELAIACAQRAVASAREA